MRALLVFMVLTWPVPVMADALGALKQPGVVALMRHALAPGSGEPARFDVEECGTQRNLDARGRAMARRSGESLRAAGVRFDAIWSSQWCRARDTALLMEMGEVQEQ